MCSCYFCFEEMCSMIRNLNQVSFQGFGNVPPERSQNAKLFEKNDAVSLVLSQDNTVIYSAKADTWVTFDTGISVLSVSQDGENFQHFYLDKPVCIKSGVCFAVSPFMEEATALLYAKEAPELVNEARHYRSKALVEANRVKDAWEDWKVLAQDTRNVYGAEAKYRLAQQLYDAGRFNEVEKEIFEFVDASTPHMYWLARSFILLSDTYVKLDRKLEARQYLLSLEQNYQADDDIAEMIKSRLEKMKDEQQTVTE